MTHKKFANHIVVAKHGVALLHFTRTPRGLAQASKIAKRMKVKLYDIGGYKETAIHLKGKIFEETYYFPHTKKLKLKPARKAE